jgi:signal peptide peptidase SppA, 36K type
MSDTEIKTNANPPSPPRGALESDWEREVITRLAFAALSEQQRARRWSILFKLLLFIYLFLLFFATAPWDWFGASLSTGKHSALVDVEGLIAEDADANADHLIAALRSAFEDKRTAGVILRINSPGGSPVQSNYINSEIQRLRQLHPDIPVYAVITDVCASGGYYVAVAADKIYADKASLVGSIGVLMESFGFVEAMRKLGIERRLITAGKHKGLLDPFSPTNSEDIEYMKQMLEGVHQQFIDVVKQGRGDRLKEHEELFSGLVWNGEQSLELGLVDGLGSSNYVAREVIGAEDIVDFTPQKDFLARFSKRLGVAFAAAVKMFMGELVVPH